MSIKQIEFDTDALGKILRGADVLADAVAVTLGPLGHNVVLERPHGAPRVTKDGVSVAGEIELPDRFENIGAQTVREAAMRTADNAGDGTTTATVLARAILREGFKCVVVGMSPVDLKRGIDRAAQAVLAVLAAMARPCDDDATIARVGTVSANGDVALGRLIADAVAKVGRDGVITVEEGQSLSDRLEIVEGMQFDRGYLSPYFISDAQRQLAVQEDVRVLLVDGKLSSASELLPVLERVASAKQPLLVVAEDVEGEALTMLVTNHLRGVLKSCAIKAPGFGEQRRAMLGDLAALTGATVVSAETGMTLMQADIGHLGRADRVEIGRDRTVLVGGKGGAALQERVKTLRAQLGGERSDHEREMRRQRLGRLAGGVAVLKLGAATEIEMQSRNALADDALRAVRAAMEEGIVVGGGVALLRAGDAVKPDADVDDEQAAGMRIVLRALEEPLRQIAGNAGARPPVVVNKVREGNGDFGFDASSGEFTDLAARGIVDPVKVVRSALQNAASVAGLLLTTGCAIADAAGAAETGGNDEGAYR